MNEQYIGDCPKCENPIPVTYTKGWCYACGEALPAELLARLAIEIEPAEEIEPDLSSSRPNRIPRSPGRRTTQSALYSRYLDAYRVARTVNGAGQTVKIVGGILAGLCFVMILNVSAQPTMFNNNSGVSAGAFFGALAVSGSIGFLFWVIGVIVAAQGQILKAALDGAVNSSPFLTDDARARLMSLPNPKPAVS